MEGCVCRGRGNILLHERLEEPGNKILRVLFGIPALIQASVSTERVFSLFAATTYLLLRLDLISTPLEETRITGSGTGDAAHEV